MAAPAACIRAKAEEWLGAQVCSPPAVRGHAALELGRIIEVNGGNVTVQYYAKRSGNTTQIWPFNAPQLVVVGPSEALAQRLAHQNAECWPMPEAGHHSSRAARGLSTLQRKVSQMVPGVADVGVQPHAHLGIRPVRQPCATASRSCCLALLQFGSLRNTFQPSWPGSSTTGL